MCSLYIGKLFLQTIYSIIIYNDVSILSAVSSTHCYYLYCCKVWSYLLRYYINKLCSLPLKKILFYIYFHSVHSMKRRTSNESSILKLKICMKKTNVLTENTRIISHVIGIGTFDM